MKGDCLSRLTIRDKPKVDLEKFKNICFSPSLLIFNNSYGVDIKIDVTYKQRIWSYCYAPN